MAEFALHVKKYVSNVLLQRKQFHIEVDHPNAASVAKTAIREQLGKMYKVNDLNRIVVGSFSTDFGGGHSHGLGRIYDTKLAAEKFERNYRLARCGIAEVTKKAVARRAKKDNKTRRSKVRGTAKSKIGAVKK